MTLQSIFSLWTLAGITILLAPWHFYHSVPGSHLFGPFNSHFVRDVGLVYLSSGAIGLFGHRTSQPALYLSANLWSTLHAVFHLHLWVHRAFPLDHIFLFDVTTVVAPPIVVWLVYWRTFRSGSKRSERGHLAR